MSAKLIRRPLTSALLRLSGANCLPKSLLYNWTCSQKIIPGQCQQMSSGSFKGKQAQKLGGGYGLWWGGLAVTLMTGTGFLVSSLAHNEDFVDKFSNRFIHCDAAPPLPKSGEPMRDRMTKFVKSLQQKIITEVEALDGTQFRVDRWERPNGTGEGISCILEDGNIFERAGVNISIVHGKLPKRAVQQMRAEVHEKLQGEGPYEFFTASISLVMHPHNPMAPTVHLNYRYFEVIPNSGSVKEEPIWWFGGGSDLTPAYLFDEDGAHFHSTLKHACDQTDTKLYPEFKTWCDKYFVNTHRKECRGIGGIFFDDVDERFGTQEQLFEFVSRCGASFLPSYIPLVEKRKDMKFDENNKLWQSLRRGRYVEFNLIHDRGTKFGLVAPNPRIESILVSLPLVAQWRYDFQPAPGSPEERLVQVLKSPIEWVPQ